MASCSGVARFVLVLLNLLLFLIGVCIIAAGILTIYLRDFIDIDLLRQSDDLRIIFDATYLVIAAWVCVGLGVFIVLISLCGCLGSACMNKVLLGIYIFVVLQVVLVQVGIGLVIVLSPAWFTDAVSVQLDDYIAQSPDDPFQGEDTSAETIGWNFLQFAVGCCGVNGISDYIDAGATSAYYRSCCKVQDRSEAALLSLDLSVEESMKEYNFTNEGNCLSQAQSQSEDVEKTDINVNGCIDELYSQLFTVGIAGIALVAIQVFIVLIACIVCCTANRDEKPI
ncbi:Leukocyte surface antigen CD53 [Holothuria leucospilota]|uniref:Tetraspanin n=1 Tax=Holothuria leucospilota TaxID=206669 RepID=A0A9Q1BEV3_HOLLE|nr:Leukocyte surface antigen CD53 [Holothuria leucospilota]